MTFSAKRVQWAYPTPGGWYNEKGVELVMNTQKNILIAFILNLTFSIFEIFGGLFTGSMAIISDAVHDIGDAASIGISYFLEKKSKQQPDAEYTYGYVRYSVIGSVITTLILLVSSIMVICNAVGRLMKPVHIDYNGMIAFAVVGVCVNFAAALFTREGGSLNQKAVNLHMLEDVLGWAVVLAGAVMMRFTDLAVIDPLMSVGVAVFIFVNAVRNLQEALELFLEKAPRDIDVRELREHVAQIDGVVDVHHIHVWSMDGQHNYATMHIVIDGDWQRVKAQVREELREHGIGHATLEPETVGEQCGSEQCRVDFKAGSGHYHHHH